MKKPIKPTHPSDTPPSRIKEIKTVVINRSDDLDLVLAEKLSIQNVYTGDFDKKVFEFIQNSIDSIALSNIINNFKIYVAEYGEIYVYLYCQQSEELYEKELMEFQNRFENYKTEMLEYEEDLKAYEEYSRAERLKQLMEETTLKINNFDGNKS